jgi:hypothetical protein
MNGQSGTSETETIVYYKVDANNTDWARTGYINVATYDNKGNTINTYKHTITQQSRRG